MRCGLPGRLRPPVAASQAHAARKVNAPRPIEGSAEATARSARAGGVIAASVLAAAGASPARRVAGGGSRLPPSTAENVVEARRIAACRPRRAIVVSSCRTGGRHGGRPPALITSGFHGSGGSGSVPTGFRRGSARASVIWNSDSIYILAFMHFPSLATNTARRIPLPAIRNSLTGNHATMVP